MTTDLPPFQPYHVRLCGHTDLGVVQARWRGCLLEIENGSTYGPAALFRVEPATRANEPKPAPTTATTGPLLRRWAGTCGDWLLLADNSQSLLRHDGLGVVAIVNYAGWLISSTGDNDSPPVASGPNLGLSGREFAREWWLKHGASDAPGADFSLHDTRAVSALDVGGQVVLIDDSAKTVVARMAEPDRILFGDGEWMYPSELADVVDHIICLGGGDDIPF